MGVSAVIFLNIVVAMKRAYAGVGALATRNSMNDSIGKAVERYSALFRLPAHETILVLLFASCVLNGFLSLSVFQLSLPYWLGLGLILGMTLFVLTTLSDYVIHFASVDKDPVLTFRRCSALSFYSLFFWVPFVSIGYVANLFFPGVWFKFFLLGFCTTLALRLLVLFGLSFASIFRIAAYAALLPILYMFSVVYAGSTFSVVVLDVYSLALLLCSVAATVAAVSLFVYSINCVGKEVVGVHSFSVLRAFMATWTEDRNAPFERLFERFSQERDIQLSALCFRGSKGQIKATMVVPTFHPGPFKNLGSSALPYAIETALEQKTDNCTVMVPHGLSGHDLDLAAEDQNQKVLDKALSLSRFSDFGASATQFLRVRRNGASASCQAFNDCILEALTLAPETMEDLPPELNSLINERARKFGFSSAIVVDAHNSIQGRFEVDEATGPLREAALVCLEEVSKIKSAGFQIGVARVVPKEFDLQHGMGPGGIAALVVKVDDQITAYITIDGNNMVSGLRERILSSLSEAGVDEGEIFTTDTHAVNAVVLDARGYHPVGEAMDQEILVKYIKQATLDALANIEPAEAAWRTETVSSVKVIGEKQIEALCILVDRAMRRAKKSALSVFPVLGAVLAVLLMLL